MVSALSAMLRSALSARLVGDWLLPRFNFHLWSGLTGMVIESAIGAIVLLVVLRTVGASGWGGGR